MDGKCELQGSKIGLTAIKQSDISLHPASLTWLGNHCNPGPWQWKTGKISFIYKNTREIDVEVKEWTTPGQADVLFQQIIKCKMIKIYKLCQNQGPNNQSSPRALNLLLTESQLIKSSCSKEQVIETNQGNVTLSIANPSLTLTV